MSKGKLKTGDVLTVQPEGSLAMNNALKIGEWKPSVSRILSHAVFQLGSYVVHDKHGIGRYQGLVLVEIEGEFSEYGLLEYAESAKLYVPVLDFSCLSAYASPEIHVPPLLSRLGSPQWMLQKKKALKSARDVAVLLLQRQAARTTYRKASFQIDETAYQRFKGEFEFVETVDQAQAIEAILKDMQSAQVMDRLICGDVGFGKTEVALRGAFVAAHAGRQVMVLVPTTLLAQQHFERFQERFASWPFKIGVLSRFCSPKQRSAMIQSVASGQVQILIGTHQLLCSQLVFKDLGLLVVDEEHRFGVTQKEIIRNLGVGVDRLTLSATPIPRSLSMAMNGLRDLSIIASVPSSRLGVQTIVEPFQWSLVVKAIDRELQRGGQIYYVHNRVGTLEETAAALQQRYSTARIVTACGQMDSQMLEASMMKFYHHQCDILVCSSIIETGLDVSNANTLIIENSDLFGLAQLHQLRGRVGRSVKQAYAYFFYEAEKVLSQKAQQRLHAIKAFGRLGSGFLLAGQDLEIRGAGEWLGDAQSGKSSSVGAALYLQMVQQISKVYQDGQAAELDDLESLLDPRCDFDLSIPLRLPDDYISDPAERLQIYRHLATATNSSEFKDLEILLTGLYGALPPAASQFIQFMDLRTRAQALGIQSVRYPAAMASVVLSKKKFVKQQRLIQLLTEDLPHCRGLQFRLVSEGTLQWTTRQTPSPADKLAYMAQILNFLEQ